MSHNIWWLDHLCRGKECEICWPDLVPSYSHTASPGHNGWREVNWILSHSLIYSSWREVRCPSPFPSKDFRLESPQMRRVWRAEGSSCSLSNVSKISSLPLPPIVVFKGDNSLLQMTLNLEVQSSPNVEVLWGCECGGKKTPVIQNLVFRFSIRLWNPVSFHRYSMWMSTKVLSVSIPQLSKILCAVCRAFNPTNFCNLATYKKHFQPPVENFKQKSLWIFM